MKFKNNKSKYILILSVVFLFFLPSAISARGNGNKSRKIAKTAAGQVGTATLDINNINALQSNVGYSDYNPNSNLEGTEFPKGTGKNDVFEGGFLWGGYVAGDPQVRVGGSAYISGLEAGPILANGKAADPSDPNWSIYRVRPDVYPGGSSVDLSGDAASTNYWNPSSPLTADQIRAQYEHDWTYWPAHGNPNAPDLGAPFTDVNHDGKYEPSIDIPGFPGADQTIFYVANDEDPSLTNGLYGTQPLGIEVHVTMWAYAQTGALGDMYFKKWQIFNKGYQKYTIDSMFVSYWTDVDLGFAGDDLYGSDTTLSMAYFYNGEPTDATYAPLPPPAIGFDFFEGPRVTGSPTDSAIYNGQVLHGYKNLPMTASYFFVNGDANFGDPPQGTPSGSTQFYHFFNGEYGLSGVPFKDPNGNVTKFAFPGNPVTGTGWIDGQTLPPGDRRGGMASGPFTMAPGDTQEVVVAEISAGAVPSVNYLQAISLLKEYDQTAQSAYNHFFNLPAAPSAPSITATPLSNKIVLSWGDNQAKVKATETTVISDELDGGQFKFEGYNVYQLPYFGATRDQAKLVATFDVIDGITAIPFTDPVTRTVEPSIAIQSGNDSGVQRYFVDSIDAFNGNKPLNNGSPYYFAVTAYSYNPIGIPQSLENPISIITVVPQGAPPGVSQSTEGNLAKSSVAHSGLADASVSVNVVNPYQVTGDKYQVLFHTETYSLGSDAKWTDITAASKRMGKVQDLTGSSLATTAAYGEAKGTVDLHYLVNVVSANYDYCDGVEIKLPAGVTLDSAFDPISNNTGSPIPYVYNKNTNTLFYSTINKDSLISGDSLIRSGNGVFAGGEDIKIVVRGVTLPLMTNYTMYDDNFGATYVDSAAGFPFGRLVDISGTDTLTVVAKQVITQKQWDVKDAASGNLVLKNQTIISGQDIYAPQSYFSQTGLYGPGGSSGSQTSNVGSAANVTFNGIQITLNGSYTAPTTISKIIKKVSSNSTYDIEDFVAFGFSDGTAAASLPSYNGNVPAGVPLSDINDLQQDYEIKWTGITGDTTINGHTVVITKSGGSYATLFGASHYSIANHPLNPKPGSTDPFLIRIPFEVWNIDKNEQVNLLVYDRNYYALNDPTKDGFSVWDNLIDPKSGGGNRVYTWVVNTKYSPTVILPTSSVVKDSATWNWVFFTSTFTTGDDIKIIYNNPIQMGKDTFTFNTQKTDTSMAQAKLDVNQINVFPNPYYGVNYLETTKYNRFVTFSHLPTTATIRIFNLAGTMIRTINHSGGTFEQWNLTNEASLPVASGLYIAYIDMPQLGTTKILKFAIIQEQQIPDHF